MRLLTLSLMVALIGGLLAGCDGTTDPKHASVDGAPTGTVSDEPVAVITPPEPSPTPQAPPPMGYDQAVRCAYLADSYLYNPATQESGLTTEQLTLMIARAREAAYAAAPREERVANIDADMRELGRQQYISSEAGPGSNASSEQIQRYEQRRDARNLARKTEVNGVCASLIN